MGALLLGACGGEDTKADDEAGNGDDLSPPVAEVDASVSVPSPVEDAGQDAGTTTGRWQPGQKIPASEMWASGSDGASREWAKLFGDWRGRPVTSTWLNLLFLPWDWLATPGLLSTMDDENKGQFKVWEQWGDFQGVVALSMSMAGTSEVTQEQYDESMRQCATGAFDPAWKAFARNAKAAGRTGENTIVSLAQEFNGAWFPWNPKNVGLQVWTDCWKRVYTAIHSESDLKVSWVFSAVPKSAQGSDLLAVPNVWDAYPGDEYVDVLGLTRYDFQDFGPSTNTDWRQTCDNEQDICRAAELAREHGKKLAVIEWSIQRNEEGYGDNSNFVQMMFGFFADNRDVLLLENNFNHYGDGGDQNIWYLYPRTTDNVRSSDKYKELYAP
ncbi:MAG: glycosyl hydrolase [Polyangiales bacterium]